MSLEGRLRVGLLAVVWSGAAAGCVALDGCLFSTDETAAGGSSTGGGNGGRGGAGQGGAGGEGAGGPSGGGGSGGVADPGWIVGMPALESSDIRVRYFDLALGDGELIVAGAAQSAGMATNLPLGGGCVLEIGGAPRGYVYPFVAFFDLDGTCKEVASEFVWAGPGPLEELHMAVARGQDPSEAFLVFRVATSSKLIHVLEGTKGLEAASLADCTSEFCYFNDVVFDGALTTYAVGAVAPGGDPCGDGNTTPQKHAAFAISLTPSGPFPVDVECNQMVLGGVLGAPGNVEHFLGRAFARPDRLVFSGYSEAAIGVGTAPCSGPCLFYGAVGDGADFELAGPLGFQPSPTCALPAVTGSDTELSAWALATPCSDANVIFMPPILTESDLGPPFDEVQQVTPQDASLAGDRLVGAGAARSLASGHEATVPWGFLAIADAGAVAPAPAPQPYYLIPRGGEALTNQSIITATAPDAGGELYFVGSFTVSATLDTTLELERYDANEALREIVLGPIELPACTQSGDCTRPFLGRWRLPGG